MAQTPPFSSLESRIDELLAEVLEDAPIVATLPDEQGEEDEDRRVVVTGLGVLSPFGVGVVPFWQG